MRRSQTGFPVYPVRQARQHPLLSPSRFPATSFPPSALDWRPGIGCTSSLDVGDRRLQCGRNEDPVMCEWELEAEPEVFSAANQLKLGFSVVIMEGRLSRPWWKRKGEKKKQNKNSWQPTSHLRLFGLAGSGSKCSLASILIGQACSSMCLLAAWSEGAFVYVSPFMWCINIPKILLYWEETLFKKKASS